ncbi:MAG: hypothetical protein K1X75_16940 [Leptospirales bacterium]|nr:hypothetical protein [Leptospirales bacterium]
MKIVHIETLLNVGPFSTSAEWARLRENLLSEIRRIDWPPGSGKFTIHPQSGKRRGEGNGVTPIKDGFIQRLIAQGWDREQPLDLATNVRPGKLDAVNRVGNIIIALEWETGNISSSHRALNKMALGILKKALNVGILVVPSRNLYQYLTDRVGNFNELQPYVDLWKALNIEDGILEIVVVEQDSESVDVPRIPKGTDGRSLQ